MAEYIASIDQGTTSTRCIFFDHSGNILFSSQKEHRQIYPQPGWVEHDPVEIWQRTQEVIHDTKSKAGTTSGSIAAVGITNQRETTLVWNRLSGEPCYNAIVWQDTRTREICDSLASEYGPDRFREKTGLPISTYFSAPKLVWMLENVPELRSRAEKGEVIFGTVDSWLTWWLTGGPDGGVHITDVTNASRTMMMNLHSLDWDPEILSILNIPRIMLPRILPSSGSNNLGRTTSSGPFAESIPIGGILGDQQAALVGQACFATGEAKNTYGTGSFMLLNTSNSAVQSTHGLLTTLAYQLGDERPTYALEGSIAITGALVQWLRDNLGLISSSSEIESLAKSVDDNGGIYFVPAFSGLLAPHWRSDARGAIVGLTRYINKGHIARAALEATAYQTRELFDAMNEDSGVRLGSMKVDGGMVSNDLLMQFQADILDVPVIRPKISETTALGAAYAAGLGIGFWSSLDELRKNWQVSQVWNPNMNKDKRSQLYRGWQKAVKRTLGWVESD